MMTNFESCKVPAIAHGIDLLEQGVIRNKTNMQFAKDIMKSVTNQYVHFNAETCHPIASYGSFYPQLLADPARYIEPQPELRQSLEQLRSRGVKLFLGTNSHFEYMNVIMETTLGQDWQQLFDLNLANCQKPVFFRDKERPFYCVDESSPNMLGTQVTNAAHMIPHNSYLEGNANMVHQFFMRQLGKD